MTSIEQERPLVRVNITLTYPDGSTKTIDIPRAPEPRITAAPAGASEWDIMLWIQAIGDGEKFYTVELADGQAEYIRRTHAEYLAAVNDGNPEGDPDTLLVRIVEAIAEFRRTFPAPAGLAPNLALAAEAARFITARPGGMFGPACPGGMCGCPCSTASGVAHHLREEDPPTPPPVKGAVAAPWGPEPPDSILRIYQGEPDDG